jgi:hypothetical protein
MYASTQRVYHKLCHTDQDSANSLVTNAEDLLAIAYDYQVYVFGIAPLIDVVFDPISVTNVQEAALGSSEQTRIISYRVTFSWCIDDREHLLQVIQDKLRASQSYHSSRKHP